MSLRPPEPPGRPPPATVTQRAFEHSRAFWRACGAASEATTPPLDPNRRDPWTSTPPPARPGRQG
jgi:hypothetical protein